MNVPPEQTSLVQAEKFWDLYNFLRNDVRATKTKIFVFVANDIDSICSLHIIQELFKEDLIPYSYRPVSSYEEMYQVAEVNMKDEEISNIIMINCGGMIDIFDFLRPTMAQAAPRLFVIDSHRPFHLKNIHHPGIVYLLDLPIEDELERDRMRAAEEAVTNGAGLEDSDAEDSGSDSSGSSAPDRAGGGKFRRLDKVPARHKQYYQAASFAFPSACIAWKLTGSRATGELAWWTAVALSDAYQHDRLSKEHYTEMLTELHDAVVGRGGDQGERGLEFVENELAFLLHRHWGLLDAMVHSRYVATRLGIWTEDGKRKLNTLLARMGVSLDQASRIFIELEPLQRERLLSGLKDHAADYGLPRYSFASFTRRVTPKLQVSAADVVHSLVGLLASQTRPRSGPPSSSATAEEALPDWADNWYRAWDALSPGREDLLLEGIEAAKKLSQAVLEQASLMLSKDIVLMVGPYRLAFLSEYLPLFTNELALLHLAAFIDSALVEYRKKPQKALLICVFNQPRGTYRMLGYVGDKPNVFGAAFRDVTLKIKVSILSHGFTHSAIEVGQPDVKRLLEFIKPTIANLK